MFYKKGKGSSKVILKYCSVVILLFGTTADTKELIPTTPLADTVSSVSTYFGAH